MIHWKKIFGVITIIERTHKKNCLLAWLYVVFDLLSCYIFSSWNIHKLVYFSLWMTTNLKSTKNHQRTADYGRYRSFDEWKFSRNHCLNNEIIYNEMIWIRMSIAEERCGKTCFRLKLKIKLTNFFIIAIISFGQITNSVSWKNLNISLTLFFLYPLEFVSSCDSLEYFHMWINYIIIHNHSRLIKASLKIAAFMLLNMFIMTYRKIKTFPKVVFQKRTRPYLKLTCCESVTQSRDNRFPIRWLTYLPLWTTSN